MNNSVNAVEVKNAALEIQVVDVNGDRIPDNIKMFLTKNNETVLHTDFDNAREIVMDYFVSLGGIEISIKHPNFNQLVASMYSNISGTEAMGLSYKFDSFTKFLGNMHRTAPSLMGGYELQLESVKNNVTIVYDENSINVKTVYIIESKEDFRTLQMAGFFLGIK